MVGGAARADKAVFEQITEIAVRIDNPATAPDLIDAALRTCITASRPVYLEIANQTALLTCRAVPSDPIVRAPVPASATSVAEATAAVLGQLRTARRAVVIGGSEIARSSLQEKFAELVTRIDAPYATSPLGKSILSELRTDLRFAGVYFGKSSPAQPAAASRSVRLRLGARRPRHRLQLPWSGHPRLRPRSPHRTARTDPSAGPRRRRPRRARSRLLGRREPGVADRPAARRARPGRATAARAVPGAGRLPVHIPDPSTYPSADPITYDSFKSLLNAEFLETFDEEHYPQIVADSGFSFLSNIDLRCAEGGFVAQLAWAAIGYGVGATAGVRWPTTWPDEPAVPSPSPATRRLPRPSPRWAPSPSSAWTRSCS